jgi:transposase-like protein
MRVSCLNCKSRRHVSSNFHRIGSYYRTSDSKWIQRFRCYSCKHNFSTATFQLCYRQKKRQKNEPLRKLLSSGVSLRRASLILNIHRNTTTRKFLFLGLNAEFFFRSRNLQSNRAAIVQFDDLETFEETKCKPLSVTLAVEQGTRRILGIEVSRMPAKGLLVKKAQAIYGKRIDERREGRRRMLRRLVDLVIPDAVIHTDSNPFYKKDVKDFFPEAKHVEHLGKRGASTGQGELKKVRFDPLFSLNHTCAMLRANINRLFRKTWCTTKKKERLYIHLMIYAQFHNESLI